MGSWDLSLRTLNGKTNLILASLKFKKKMQQQKQQQWKLQRLSPETMMYSVTV